MSAVIGQRIQIIGNSCSGKSTLAAELGQILGLPVVELDALNFEPGWIATSETQPDEFERRVVEATRGDRWIVAGSYSKFTKRLLWDRLDCVIWLDLPRPLLLARVIVRSWRRHRSRELLWGSNRERFWPQLAVWRQQDSLVWWIWTQHHPKRARMLADRVDPRFGHIRFHRLDSLREIRAFVESIAADHQVRA